MSSRFTRRAMLRGAGALMALPALEATAPLRAFGAEAAGAPRRMAFLFFPNGVNTKKWFPTAFGADYELPPSLEPLAPFRNDLLVLSGLARPGRGPTATAPATTRARRRPS